MIQSTFHLGPFQVSYTLRPSPSRPELPLPILSHSMAPLCGFVTWDMLPPEWIFTPEQEATWIERVIHLMPGEPPQTVQRHVCFELPDCPMAFMYQRAYLAAAETRDDLVPPMITGREQWESRPDRLAEVVWCLLTGRPPLVSICAILGRRPVPPG